MVSLQETVVSGVCLKKGQWAKWAICNMSNIGNFHFLQFSSSYCPPVFIIGEHGDGKQIGPHLEISSSTRRDGGGDAGGVGGGGGRRCRMGREKSENKCVAEKRCHHNTWMSCQDFFTELSNTTAKQDSGF